MDAEYQQQLLHVGLSSPSSSSTKQDVPPNEMPSFLVPTPEVQKESRQSPRTRTSSAGSPAKDKAKTPPPLAPRVSTTTALPKGLPGLDSNQTSAVSPQPKTPAQEYMAKALELMSKTPSPIPFSRAHDGAPRVKAPSPRQRPASGPRTPVPCPSDSNVSLTSQRSAGRGKSPSPAQRSAPRHSPVPDRSLADMLAAQRRKAASPRPAARGRSAPQGRVTPVRASSADQHAAPAPTSPSATSMSPALSPVTGRQPAATPASDVSPSDSMSSRHRRSVSHSVSPNRFLVGAALKTNGAAGLKNMLARQRKASKDKEGAKLKATKADISVQPKQEDHAQPVQDQQATPTFPLESVTMSVYEKRVDREGKPTSSVVTITQKKIRYTKEPIRDGHQTPTNGPPSPPMISSVPLPTTATVHQPTAIFPGEGESGERKEPSARVTSAPASKSIGHQDGSVKRDAHHHYERTRRDKEDVYQRARDRTHDSRRPMSGSAKQDSSPAPPSPLPRHWVLGMMDSESQGAEVILKKHPARSPKSPKPYADVEAKHGASSPNSLSTCKTSVVSKNLGASDAKKTFQKLHDELSEVTVFSQPTENQEYDLSHPKTSPMPVTDFNIGLMKERELLLRRRMQSKKHREKREPPRIQSFRSGDSEESDFSDFFKEYQTECEKKGISADKTITQYLGTISPKREKAASPKTRGTPGSTSPPVKRRAVDDNADLDSERWAEADRPSNTCNSSPVRRARGHELLKFQAYPLRPPRTNPMAQRDRNELPLALSQQFQTYRHQQGVVGDSVEMMQVFEPRRIDEPGTADAPFPTQSFSRGKSRRKHGRRVSWNDNQSSSGAAAASQNQNAVSPSAESLPDEDTEVSELNRSRHAADTSREYAVIESQRNNSRYASENIFENPYGTGISYSQGDPAITDEKETVKSPRHHHTTRRVAPRRELTGVRELRQHQQSFEKEDKKVSRTFTDSSTYRAAIGATGENVGADVPPSIQFSREQKQTTLYRPKENDDTSFAKEELIRRKEFAAKIRENSTSLSQNQTVRKQYTMQSQRKRAVVTEERQHTKEYIFKKNPRTARFPEQTGYLDEPPQDTEQPPNHNAPLPSKDRRSSLAAETQDGARTKARATDAKTELAHPQKLLRDRPSSATSSHSLNLSEELRNAGFSAQQYTRQSPSANTHSDDGDSVDMMDYGSVDGGTDESVDPYPYPYAYSRSHIYDLNESANSSALADCDDKQSPGQNAREWDCAFFTPEVDADVTGAVGGVVDIRLAHHEVIDDQLNFQSPASEAGEWLPKEKGSSYDKTRTLALGSADHDKNGNTLYFSVYDDDANTNAKHEDGSSPPGCEPAARRRRRRYEQSDNRNNSGDDHSKFTAGQNRLRQAEHDYTPYENPTETECGEGDHKAEAAKADVTEEVVECGEKASDCTSYPRTKASIVRRRRSFGTSYISRLMARRGYCETESQDSSDNCAQRYSYRVPEEDCVEARCCQSEIGHCASEVAHECESTMHKHPYCEEYNCADEQVELCPCTEGAECGRHQYGNQYGDGHKLMDNCCQACDCAAHLTAALNLRDARHVPRAVIHPWQTSSDMSRDCHHHPDCAVFATPCDEEPGTNSYEAGEEVEVSPHDSIPSPYSDDCQCADACGSSGRGDGDVHPDARKAEGDFNVSKCYPERSHRRRASQRIRRSAESGHERPEIRHGEENDEEFRGDQGADNYHDHHRHYQHQHHHHQHHHRQDHDNKLSARSGTSLIRNNPSVRNDVPRSSSGKEAHFTVTESMVQAYGYNPLTESPFTARGYPELPMDTSTLDHISVPFVKRKALVFLRTEKEEFVEVGRGTYGCVYLAQATTRRGTTKVVVKVRTVSSCST